ncbi:MAG TPA: hypothetical protein VG488_09490 [Candidatus Angelobacter sp.]|jgi:hypothetical protein|nr:hypothetical protein [Candidatus Angelobacter sp.]
MRITVDIPDVLYRRLKSVAAVQGCSVKELVLRGVKGKLAAPGSKHKRKLTRIPVIDSKRPGWLRLSNCTIHEILFP